MSSSEYRGILPSALLTEPGWPSGFTYVPELISQAEESDLLRFIETLDLGPFVYMGTPSKRQVRNFGVDFDYDRKIAVAAAPIPHEFDLLLDRISQVTGEPRAKLSELLVTCYPAGAAITWHKDSRSFESIYGVSLLSSTILKLRPIKARDKSQTVSVEVAPRSLYALRDEARTGWLHHVPPVHETRISITVRTLRPNTTIYEATNLSQYQMKSK